MVSIEKDTPRVLIVDDKPENLAILIQILDTFDVEIFTAHNGIEALLRIESYEFDLILLDIVMPKMGGFEVAKAIKSNPITKDIPLIFISTLNGFEDKIKAFSYGGDDYITKPFIQEELIARIRLHLQKGLILKSLKQLLRRSYHELYNPLAIINTSIEMQKIKHGNTKYIDSVTIASRTLQLVYDDIYYTLSSKKNHEKTKSIELHEFVRNRIEYFRYLSDSKNIVIDFKTSEDSNIQMKEADLYRIIDNTLSNAIKYAKEDTIVNIDILDKGDNIVFRTKNLGSTIDNPDKVFHNGYRENHEQIGMGIGLEIVASICNTYNIDPNVESKNGITIFSYQIPKNTQKY